MPVEPFAIPIPVSDAHLANFGRLAEHIIAAVNDFNARGDVYTYGPGMPAAGPLFKVIVTASALSVRQGPSTAYPAARYARRDDVLDVWEVDAGSGWFRVSHHQSEWITGSQNYTRRL